ncbi:hypothetical protein FACS1894164_13200 [Spirochaetia bacterium]|nr:hypothetical protein FACS1894164_13200 [Spirochaetia bacterium]
MEYFHLTDLVLYSGTIFCLFANFEYVTGKRIKCQIPRLSQFQLKVDIHHISKENLSLLQFLFVQVKWVVNDMIAFSQTGDIFMYEYKEHRQGGDDKPASADNERMSGMWLRGR